MKVEGGQSRKEEKQILASKTRGGDGLDDSPSSNLRIEKPHGHPRFNRSGKFLRMGAKGERKIS